MIHISHSYSLCLSQEHGDHYYWNKVSGKTQWEKPAELAWRRVKVADEGSDEM